MQLGASVFQHAHEGIIITDANGCIVEINPAGCEITGYPRGVVVGRDLAVLKASEEDPRTFRRLWNSLKAAGSWRGELCLRRANGERYTELLTVYAVRAGEDPVSHYLVMFTDISALKKAQHRLDSLACHDALTQLPNRARVAEVLQRAMARARSRGQWLAVCCLDLDGFKMVNESLGHEAGDRLLIEVARRLRRRLRGDDTAARLGGDEFVLLLGGLESVQQGEHALRRIMTAIARDYLIDGVSAGVSASVGMTLFPQDDTDPDTLLRHAGQALYLAKQAGGNRYHLFDPGHDRLTRSRLDRLAQIRIGLAGGEFSLHYQPKVDIRRGVVVGVEALVRWNHPERGQLIPSDFMPLIENSELSIDFEDWVLDQAIGQLAAWWQQGVRLAVSVNVSADLLQRDDFVERLVRLLARHRHAPADYLELEVLETMALEDLSRVSANIEESRRLGVLFALDDFGTGYSSLTYLRRLPVSTLKIDRTFICDMLERPEDLAIVEAVIQLAKVLGRSVIAEGVETAEHGRWLTGLNCDVVQGFGIAPPMHPDRVVEWVANYRPDPMWLSARGPSAVV